MANTDVLVRMKADTSNYDANIAKAKKQLDDFGKNNLTAGGQIKQMTSTLVSSAAKFASFGAAAAAAMKVAKDAFFNNEESLDEWGRTVESVESIYKGFLNSLNTGDISGFLSNIQTITQAARDAYDALDELATFTAFNKANVAGARADLSGSIADYREGKGSKDAVSKASEALIKELETKQKLQEEAYKKVIAKVAAERGVKESDLMKVMTGNYGTFKELKDLQYTGKKTTMVATGGTFTSGPTYRQITEAVPANEREKLAQAIKHLNDTEIDNFQGLAEAAKMTSVEINNQRKMVARVLNGKQPGEDGKSGKGSTEKQKQELTELQANQKKINALTLEYVKLGDESTASAKERQAEIQNEIRLLEQRNGLLRLREENAKGRLLVSPGDIQKEGLSNFGGINPQGSILPNTDMSIKIPLQIDDKSFKVVQDQVQAHVNSLVKGGKDSAKAWSLAANAVSSIGSALNEVDDPAIKAAGTIAQAVASIALGFAMASATPSTAGTGWGWLAWLAAGATAMATTISTIHSLTGYAEGGKVRGGGIIEGNSYSGDNIPIMANAGEIVLNRSMQANLASSLQGQGSGMHIVGQIAGEKIVLVANRYFKRTGQGEIVTW